MDLRLGGTFGASNHPGETGEYVAVQGWLFPYIASERVSTTNGRFNHLYLRYLRADAGDNDWDMTSFSGRGTWRLLGWEPDTYGEFEGFDTWPYAAGGRAGGS
ncbi:MAG: hypothetical protein KDB14_05860 [Planctomycetales bacterium]|nr:hypothetical protein [Planctomycetales bacterium]